MLRTMSEKLSAKSNTAVRCITTPTLSSLDPNGQKLTELSIIKPESFLPIDLEFVVFKLLQNSSRNFKFTQFLASEFEHIKLRKRWSRNPGPSPRGKPAYLTHWSLKLPYLEIRNAWLCVSSYRETRVPKPKRENWNFAESGIKNEHVTDVRIKIAQQQTIRVLANLD